MTAERVLVIGGGPAGASAAATLAESGLSVRLIEQRDQLGGAIHRQSAPGAHRNWGLPARHVLAWKSLSRRIAAAGDRIRVQTQSVFLGVDRSGLFLIDNRLTGRVEACRVKAAIVAVGAVEKVHPFEGWELPRVMTAGGAQVLLKETGLPPVGPILVAGNGPLLLAISAQLAKAGNPPVTVLERGRPWRKLSLMVRQLGAVAQMAEAAAYAATLAMHRVPYRTGSNIVSARRDGDLLDVTVRSGRGVLQVYRVAHLLVHDGVVPNVTGLPAEDLNGAVPVALAGDGREILGADAAILDGERAARAILSRLDSISQMASPNPGLKSAQSFQASLKELFRAPLPDPTADTIICRCEHRSYADLAALAPDSSDREIRLIGRFGMGVCQGRFCGSTLASLRTRPEAVVRQPRWPLRPVAISALANLHDLTTPDTEN